MAHLKVMNLLNSLASAKKIMNELEEYDDAYVKTDVEGFIHLYQEGEDENEWNYVKMTEDYDVITEKTFTI